jgi:hypothetical protein
MTTPETTLAQDPARHWSARPWFGLVTGVALVAPWAVLTLAPNLTPVVVFAGPVLAGLVAGYLADRGALPGLLGGAGYALPALVIAVVAPCRGTPAWNEALSGAILLLVLGPVIGVLGSRLGARLARAPSGAAGPLVLTVVVIAGLVLAGTLVLAGQRLIAGCLPT